MRIQNAFGMTETSGGSTSNLYNVFRLDTCNFALPGTEIKIDKPDQTGEGEVCLRGRHSMMGYFKNEEATKNTIDAQGWVHSGDLGKLEDGFLSITGRIKELIITAGGENVAPIPIEDCFKEEFPPCSNIVLVGENQRFIASLITFKVDLGP